MFTQLAGQLAGPETQMQAADNCHRAGGVKARPPREGDPGVTADQRVGAQGRAEQGVWDPVARQKQRWGPGELWSETQDGEKHGELESTGTEGRGRQKPEARKSEN